MPECMLQNMAQPHRKPSAGDHASLRNTYTPPVRGKAAASRAQISAPKSVSTPQTSHTANIPRTSGTSRVISEGCTKIDAPMMIPTTSAVARTKPIERVMSASLSFHQPRLPLGHDAVVREQLVLVHGGHLRRQLRRRRHDVNRLAR